MLCFEVIHDDDSIQPLSGAVSGTDPGVLHDPGKPAEFFCICGGVRYGYQRQCEAAERRNYGFRHLVFHARGLGMYHSFPEDSKRNTVVPGYRTPPGSAGSHHSQDILGICYL